MQDEEYDQGLELDSYSHIQFILEGLFHLGTLKEGLDVFNFD